MRIAVACWSRKRFGGSETQLDALIPSLVRGGHQVGMLCEVDYPLALRDIRLAGDAPVWCVRQMGGAALSAVRAWRPDIVYAHGLRDDALEDALLEIAPVVYYVHDYVGSCISGAKAHSFPRARPCERLFGPGCILYYFPRRCGGLDPRTMWRLYRRERRRRDRLNRYRVVLAASEWMRREYLKLGFPEDSLRVVAPPVLGLADRLLSDAGSMHEKPAFPDQPELLYLGRMVKLKGGEFLIGAAARVASQLGRPIRVTMAGDGPARDSWYRLARNAHGPDQRATFEFPGWLEDHDREQALARADLLVMPSLWPEPFGVSGLEAGVHGVPAAGFAVGGIPEWLTDGFNGHLAPGDPPTVNGLTDAIVKCLANRDHYRQLVRGARHRAARYTIANHVTRLLNIFEEVLA